MKKSHKYVASKLRAGDFELLRQGTFTRWMSRDLVQAAVNFCRNLGLLPAYCECSAERFTRYLFWRVPQDAFMEVRSGRTRNAFEEFDTINRGRNSKLLSLHINESEVYSAVWISADHFEAARAFLAAHGISAAKRPEA
jgi:hypothetical protein